MAHGNGLRFFSGFIFSSLYPLLKRDYDYVIPWLFVCLQEMCIFNLVQSELSNFLLEKYTPPLPVIWI